MLCKGAKINVEDVKIKINEFPEGKWAKITYKFKISGQEITKLNITEEDPGIFREINNKWYLVEKNQNAPGFNLIDLPPDMRKLLLDQINNKRKYF